MKNKPTANIDAVSIVGLDASQSEWEMVLCLVALVVFSALSAGSAKYKRWAHEALRCVIKNITLSPCDVGLEQRIKGKITAKLMVVPPLARIFYRYFTVISWAFTISFFASMIYTIYSIYNYFRYGSCDPGGVCYITWIGWCILLVEKFFVYVVILIVVAVGLYLLYGRLRHKSD